MGAIVGARAQGKQSAGNFGLGMRNSRRLILLLDLWENKRIKLLKFFSKKGKQEINSGKPQQVCIKKKRSRLDHDE